MKDYKTLSDRLTKQSKRPPAKEERSEADRHGADADVETEPSLAKQAETRKRNLESSGRMAEEFEQLKTKWSRLLEDGSAIGREEIQHAHGVPASGWETFYARHFLNNSDFVEGQDYFSFDDTFLCLKSVDDAIGKDSIEEKLGQAADRYEGKRLDDRTGTGQTHADDWEIDDDGKTRYFERGSEGRARPSDIYYQP